MTYIKIYKKKPNGQREFFQVFTTDLNQYSEYDEIEDLISELFGEGFVGEAY